MGAAHFDHIVKGFGLFPDFGGSPVHSRQELLGQPIGGDPQGGGNYVIGGLGHVHMIVGTAVEVFPLLLAQKLQRPVGQDLVHIHVDGGACPSLDGVHNKLPVELSLHCFFGGLHNGLTHPAVQQMGLHIGAGRRFFHLCQGLNQGQMNRHSCDGEVLHRPDGLDAVIGISRNLLAPKKILFRTGFHKVVS
ncbi:hypothetical protein D3C75_806240 [compost metagenome]